MPDVDHVTTAVKLGAAGFRVFPLQDIDGETKRINGWPDKATSDPHEIVELFTGREVVGVAIATGDDFTVVDIDEKNGKSGSAALKAAGVKLPKTLVELTSGGPGRHLVYRTTGAAPKTHADVVHPEAGKLEGVDVRGAGGYFRVHDADALIAGVSKATEAPSWLPAAGERIERTGKPSTFLDELRAIERHNFGRNAQAGEDSIEIVAEFRRMSPNIGHDDLLALSDKLADVISTGAPGASWAVGAARSIYANDAPAGSDWEGAFDAALFGLEKLRLPLRSFRLTRREKAALDAHKRGKTPKAKPGKPGRLSDLMTRDFPPLGWVVDEIIPEGTTLLVAAPKIGKSLLALDVAVAAATGRDAFGGVATGEPRPVLYLDLESGERRLQSRVLAQGWDDFGRFRYHLEAATAVETLRRFMRKHAGQRPLAILDTLAAVMTDRGDRATLLKHEYDSLKVYQEITAGDPGSAVIIVHHTRKLDSSDPLAMASGTHGTTGAVDHVLYLTRPDRMRTDGVLSRMSRDVEDAEFELRLRDARWYAAGGSAEEAQKAHEAREHERKLNALGPLANALIMLVNSSGGATLSVETIFDRYQGASDRDTVARNLARLAKQGHIEKVGRGAYAARMLTTTP